MSQRLQMRILTVCSVIVAVSAGREGGGNLSICQMVLKMFQLTLPHCREGYAHVNEQISVDRRTDPHKANNVWRPRLFSILL